MNIHIKLLGLFFVLTILAGCVKEVDVYQEKIALRNKIKRQLEIPLTHQSKKGKKNVEELLQRGISRNDAISIALQHNPHLQADLETLGIAKTDVQQAGLFTNPAIQTVFYAPLRGPTLANTTQCDINLADFWLVPLRKKVQQKEFEQTSLRILSSILDIIKETSIAYARVLLYQNLSELYNEIEDKREALLNAIKYRSQFGLEDKLDRVRATTVLAQTKNQSIQNYAHLLEAYAQLRFTMGICPTVEPITLTDSLKDSIQDIAPVETLISYAQANRPDLLEAQLAEQQYQAKLSLEKASVFKEINAGVAFQQEFDRNRGIGASLSFDFPLFDTNQVQVNRTRYLLRQACLNTKHITFKLSKEIYQLYTRLQALGKQIATYTTTIMPAAQESLVFADHYQQIQQITTPELLHVYTDWFEHKLSLFHLYHEKYQAMIYLERATAKRITVE